jgi:hypothetical protein
LRHHDDDDERGDPSTQNAHFLPLSLPKANLRTDLADLVQNIDGELNEDGARYARCSLLHTDNSHGI